MFQVLRWSRSVLLALSITMVASGSISQHATTRPKPLVVGWQDEFQKLDAWSPWTASGGFDILRGDVGKLTVVLGKTSMYMSVFKHYRAGVYQDFDVDLDHYPVLAVRVSRFRKASTWDGQVLQYREANAPDAHDISKGGGIPVPGNPAHLAADEVGRSGGQREAGIVFVDVKARPSDVGKKHVRLLLNLSGPQQQGYVEFDWVRFLQREDVARLRAHPDLQDIQLSD